MMIKICGITRRQDAEAAVEVGASALGFIFYLKSPRYVTPSAAAALGEGLEILKVGVFVDESPAAIEAVMRTANLDIAQIYGGTTPANTRVWKAFRRTHPPSSVPRPLPSVPHPLPSVPHSLVNEPRPSGSGLTLVTMSEDAEAILLDGPSNGISFDWALARAYQQKIILAGGLDASNVAEAIRIAQPWGVDASSKLESAPGIKDHEKVRAFVRAARRTK
jgi:phosphoribosylanthranilate isomerase